MKAKRLHVIMSFTRSRFAAPIFNYYLRDMQPHSFEVRIHVGVQGPEPDPKGNNKFNEALDIIPQTPNDWVFGCGDDAIHSPALFRRLGEVIRDYPTAVGIVVAEDRGPHSRPSGILMPNPSTMKPCQVDGTQVILRRDFIGNERLDYIHHKDQHDGYFIQKLFNKQPSGFFFVNEVLVNFNNLMWDDPKYRNYHSNDDWIP